MKRFNCLGTLFLCEKLEEVSMKWMDRPNVADMEGGGVYEMHKQKKVPKMELQLKWIKCNDTFDYISKKILSSFIDCSGISTEIYLSRTRSLKFA